MAPHSSTLAWKIPCMEEPGRLQSIGSLRVGQDSATSLSLFTFMHWRRKWQPTPVFLPGESQGRGSLVGFICGVAQSRTRLKRLSSSSGNMEQLDICVRIQEYKVLMIVLKCMVQPIRISIYGNVQRLGHFNDFFHPLAANTLNSHAPLSPSYHLIVPRIQPSLLHANKPTSKCMLGNTKHLYQLPGVLSKLDSNHFLRSLLLCLFLIFTKLQQSA